LIEESVVRVMLMPLHEVNTSEVDIEGERESNENVLWEDINNCVGQR
jgi:hypothetical protein